MFRVSFLGCSVQGAGFRISGLGLRVSCECSEGAEEVPAGGARGEAGEREGERVAAVGGVPPGEEGGAP